MTAETAAEEAAKALLLIHANAGIDRLTLAKAVPIVRAMAAAWMAGTSCQDLAYEHSLRVPWVETVLRAYVRARISVSRARMDRLG